MCIDGAEILKQDYTDVTSYICISAESLPQAFTRQMEHHDTLLQANQNQLSLFCSKILLASFLITV